VHTMRTRRVLSDGSLVPSPEAVATITLPL
jgi:hypothetical protein